MSAHVIRRGRRWAVLRTGATRASRLFDAFDAAAAWAKARAAIVYTYDDGGRISGRWLK